MVEKLLKEKLQIKKNRNKIISLVSLLLVLFVVVLSVKKKQSNELEYMELQVIGNIVGTYEEGDSYTSSGEWIKFLNVYRRDGKYKIDINPLYVKLKMDNNYKEAEELMQTKKEVVNLMQLRLDDLINNGYQSFLDSLPKEVKKKTISLLLDYAKEDPNREETINFILNGGSPIHKNGIQIDVATNIVHDLVDEVIFKDKINSEKYEKLHGLSDKFFRKDFYPIELYDKEKK